MYTAGTICSYVLRSLLPSQTPVIHYLLPSNRISQQRCPVRRLVSIMFWTQFIFKTYHIIQGVFSLLYRKAPSRYSIVYFTLSKGYCHCARLSGFRHRLLNLPDMRRMTQRWRSVVLAFIGQAGKETSCINSTNFKIAITCTFAARCGMTTTRAFHRTANWCSEKCRWLEPQ
jgi:hypothetical protein